MPWAKHIQTTTQSNEVGSLLYTGKLGMASLGKYEWKDKKDIAILIVGGEKNVKSKDPEAGEGWI